MCECLEKISDKLIEKENEKHQGTFVCFPDQNIMNDQLTTPIEISYTDKKRKKTIRLAFTYCPICGEEYC